MISPDSGKKLRMYRNGDGRHYGKDGLERKMITFSIIGLGNRGSVYADGLMKLEDVKITAVCDTCPESLTKAKDVYGVAEEHLFLNDDAFFAEKRADILIVSTMDEYHKDHAIRGMQLGYDILLEKPVAPTMQDCLAILEAGRAYGRDIVICHNLRYTPFYQEMKRLLAEGTIGDVVSVEQSENVAYHHYMCSFIRGKWRKKEETSSIVLQKCCHDLDIITWFAGNRKCELRSIGDLRFYKSENAPENCAERCMDCAVRDCPYNAYEFYAKAPGSLCVPYGFAFTEENLRRYLCDRSNPYGRCVFQSDNDVCDRQTVSIRYENGVTASLLLHGFANDTDRITKVYGTKGCIYGEFNSGVVHVDLFDGTSRSINVNGEISSDSHNGGDIKLTQDYVAYKKTGKRPLGISKIEDSVKSHELAFSAEASRAASEESGTPMKLRFEHPVTKTGVYDYGADFLKAGKCGALQIISISANISESNLKHKVENDLCYAAELAQSDLLRCCVNVSARPYRHGTVDMYFANGVLLRYTLVCSPLKEDTEIRLYGTRGTIFCFTKDNTVRLRSTALFEPETIHTIEAQSGCTAEKCPEAIEKIVRAICEAKPLG